MSLTRPVDAWKCATQRQVRDAISDRVDTINQGQREDVLAGNTIRLGHTLTAPTIVVVRATPIPVAVPHDPVLPETSSSSDSAGGTGGERQPRPDPSPGVGPGLSGVTELRQRRRRGWVPVWGSRSGHALVVAGFQAG